MMVAFDVGAEVEVKGAVSPVLAVPPVRSHGPLPEWVGCEEGIQKLSDRFSPHVARKKKKKGLLKEKLLASGGGGQKYEPAQSKLSFDHF